MIPLIAEFLGTYALVTAILFTGNFIIIALTLGTVIWAIEGISGAHINPAVTFAMWLKGGFSVPKVIRYISAQLLGAATAYYVSTILI